MTNSGASIDQERLVHQRLIAVQSSLYAFIYSLLGNGSDAYDVLQEANVAMLAKAAEYDGDRPFFAWACGFAKLQVMAHRKRVSRDMLWFDAELVSVLAEESSASMEGLGGRFDALTQCLDKLDGKSRSLIAQCYENGRKPAEVAAILGLKAATLRTRVFRVRQMLADCIQRQTSAEAL